MNLLKSTSKTCGLLVLTFLFSQTTIAHNGKVAHAFPLGKITVDGDFSDWPRDMVEYSIGYVLLEGRPAGPDDYEGFFQVGYRAENHSLYLAITVTDNEFVEDTSANVRFNTQDGVELCLDGRHLPFGSGVASFMYSKKLRNINKAHFDSFAKNASWEMMEVVMKRVGNKRYYEWRIDLADQLVVGKSIGLEVQVFDKDAGHFSAMTWGKGEYKYRLPKSLGDVLLLPAKQSLSTVKGRIAWNEAMKLKLPGTLTITSSRNPRLWIRTEVDTLGNYAAEVPAGKYSLGLGENYLQDGEKRVVVNQQNPANIVLGTSEELNAEKIVITGAPVPDLLPVKGVMHNYGDATPMEVDKFVEAYQKYYDIPGVSLALIKDGKVVYHKTYGVKNTFTGEKVDANTLFEAASVTKPVFSFAVMRLAERGVIDLNKPLYLYLPYEDIAYDERYKLITAMHVLTHRTGFPNWRSMNENGKLDLKFTPGTDYNYSGEGFEYLKMVVEKITGKKVEQILKEEVIDPMGLYHTFFSRNDSLRRMVADGHNDMLPNFDELPESPGMAWSMHTEAKIFTRFMLFMLEQKGLQPATYDSLLTKHSAFKFDPGEEKPKHPSYMGISLEIRETPWGKSFGHGGNNGDFQCQFEVYKDLKMGYVVFTNSNTGYPMLQAIRQFLVDGKD